MTRVNENKVEAKTASGDQIQDYLLSKKLTTPINLVFVSLRKNWAVCIKLNLRTCDSTLFSRLF